MGYLKLEARAEGHRSASLSYNEIFRHLSVILARRSSERPPVFMVMENTEQSLLQLEKIAPLIPSYICNRIAKKEKLADRFEPHQLPSELSGISSVEVFKRAEAVLSQVVVEATRPKRPHRHARASSRPASPTPPPSPPPELFLTKDHHDRDGKLERASVQSPKTDSAGVAISEIDTFSDASPSPSDE